MQGLQFGAGPSSGADYAKAKSDHISAQADHAPACFDPMSVRVLELQGDLLPGPSTAFKFERHLVPAQMVSGAEHFVQGPDLKGKIMQFFICVCIRRRPPTSAMPW